MAPASRRTRSLRGRTARTPRTPRHTETEEGACAGGQGVTGEHPGGGASWAQGDRGARSSSAEPTQPGWMHRRSNAAEPVANGAGLLDPTPGAALAVTGAAPAPGPNPRRASPGNLTTPPEPTQTSYATGNSVSGPHTRREAPIHLVSPRPGIRQEGSWTCSRSRRTLRRLDPGSATLICETLEVEFQPGSMRRGCLVKPLAGLARTGLFVFS